MEYFGDPQYIHNAIDATKRLWPANLVPVLIRPIDSR